jgi:signal transduction histidine kinase
MHLRQAIRLLSNWKSWLKGTFAKPTIESDVDGVSTLPAAEMTALQKIQRSLAVYAARLWELFDSSFRAKVLVPVAGCMTIALLATFFVMDHRIAGQSEQEARNTLATANATIRYSQDFRRNDLLLRFHNLPNESLWRQIFQLGGSKDLHNTLSDLMQMQRVDILFYTSNRGKILDVEKNDPGIPIQEFEAAALPVTQVAVHGEEKTDTVFVGGKLYDVVTVPAYNQDNSEQIGVVTLGSELGDAVVQEFSKLTQSQVAFVAGGHVTASTLPGLDANEQFSGLSALSANESHDAAANVKPIALNGVHYYGIAGRFASLNPDNHLGYVLLSSREQSLAAIRATRIVLIGLGLLAVGFCATAVWFFVTRLTDPLRELRQGAEDVGRGDFNRRVPVRSRDECGQLALVFNGMTENIQQSRSQLEKTVESLKTAQEQLVQSEKLSAVGKFVAGVAHELNNPLTAVVGFSEVLKRGTPNGKNENYADTILKAAMRCKRIVQSLLSFARREQSERKLASINNLVEMALDIVGYALRTGNIEVITQLDADLPFVFVDTSKIQQVLLNILNNAQEAIQSAGQPGQIKITTETQKPNVRINIQDSGPGIPREHLRRIFDPFFTTKEIGKGTGLGLSLCYGYIQEHHGNITALSQVGKGTTFVIDLPIAENSEAPPEVIASLPAEPKPNPREGKGKRVLVVDDEPPILNLIQGDFTLRGYEVEVAENGRAALTKLEKNHFDLAFCDWKMPGLTGQQIYEQLRRTHPEFCRRIIFITGDVINDQMREFLEREKRPCLAKPFTLEELHSTVEGLLKTV